MSGSPQAHAPGQQEEQPLPGRGRSFSAANRHSGVVRVLKVAIPAGSILAVAAVVGFSFFNPLGRIPGLSVGPVTMSGSKIAMESPRLTGFRKDNRGYEVTATVAYQDLRKPNILELNNMTARLATDDSGGRANLVSRFGVYDSGKEHMDLSEDVKVWTEKGEQILMRSASVDFKTGITVSREPVAVRTPTLTVDAQGLEIADNGARISFSGRVRTVLTPGPDGKTASNASAPPAPAPVAVAPALAPVVVTAPAVIAAPVVKTPARVIQAEAGVR